MKWRWPMLAVLLAAQPVLAQVRPQPGGGDPRIQLVDFRPDQVVLIEGAPGYLTTIELAPDEMVRTIAVGDSGGWQVSASREGNRLFVKALAGGSTNLSVVTSARTYTFDLASVAEPSLALAYTVRFRYPVEPGAAIGSDRVAGRYRLGGARVLRPARIHDDGVHTYLEWAADVPLPAVYAIDRAGREQLANGHMRDGVYVIDSIERELRFRIDRQQASARRYVEEAGRR